MKKKLASITALSLALVMTLSACGNNNTKTPLHPLTVVRLHQHRPLLKPEPTQEIKILHCTVAILPAAARHPVPSDGG